MPPPNVSPTSPGGGTRPTTTSPNGLRNDRFVGDATFEKIASGKATLGSGAKGASVKKLQTALLDMGFSVKPYQSKSSGRMVGGVDGDYGGQTTNALLNFQRHASRFYKDVRPTGTLDAATLKALDKLAPRAGMKAWAPGANTKLPSPYWNGDKSKLVRVVVVKSEHRTYVFDKAGKISGIFSNSTGSAGNETDEGYKVVRTKLDEKSTASTGARLWKDSTVYGPRMLDLSWADGRTSGEELHGTNAPQDLGKDVSHGCMRHYNEDIIKIFDQLSVGDRVAVVNTIDDPRLSKG